MCVCSCSRTVIAVGLEEEDRMDQWVQDAESVSVCMHVCSMSFQSFDLTTVVHGTRGLRVCTCYLRPLSHHFPQQEEHLAESCLF